MSFADSHYVVASTTGGGLLRKPMNQPLNRVAEIQQAPARNLWNLICPVIELVGPWNLGIGVSYIPIYKTAISDKTTCWEGEQFNLIGYKYLQVNVCNRKVIVLALTLLLMTFVYVRYKVTEFDSE